MKDNYAGIDYGRGMSNVDPETGIRYGVINQNKVLQAWADSSEPNYGPPTCPDCGQEITNIDSGECGHCGYDFEEFDFDCMEPLSFFIDDNEYKAECGEDSDIFITKSPYFTFAQFCSPCAPGAIYLTAPFVNEWENSGTNQNGVMSPEDYPNDYKNKAKSAGFARGYCFGHDWFENGKAPYPVFSVETGEIIFPEKEE